MMKMLQVVLPCCLLLAATAQHRLNETGMPSAEAVLTVVDYPNEQALDEALDPYTGLASTHHVFIGVYEKTCKHMLHEPWFLWGSARSVDPTRLATVRIERCSAPRLVEDAELPDACASVVYLPMGGHRSHLIAFPADRDLESEYVPWAQDLLHVEQTFRNVHESRVEVYYKGEGGDGKENRVATLDPGHETTIGTWVSHVFYVVESKSRMLMEYFDVEKGGVREVGIWKEVVCEADDQASARECDDRQTELLRYAYGVWYRQRMALNVLQPAGVEPFTAAGFEKHKLPDHIFAPLQEYWEVQQPEIEQEHLVGPAINQLDAPTEILTYPRDLKTKLFDAVRPLLERWIGGKKLVGTSCYGIRKYTHGSRLLMHVDTIDTHAVSGIINVAQGLSSPWPLHILDHHGRLHEVTMEPGEIVFYESARLLHGRPTPLNGSYYANIFIHYKPADGWHPRAI